MASSGPLYPATTVNDTSVGNTAWTNVNNAQSLNSTVATIGSGAGGWRGNYLKATNFGFNIPAGSKIDGVFFEAVGVFGSNHKEDSVRLVNRNVISGNDKSTDSVLLGSAANYSYGTSSDLWGLNLTVADVNNPGFGVVWAVGNTSGGGESNVDALRLTVHYTPSPLSIQGVQSITGIGIMAV